MNNLKGNGHDHKMRCSFTVVALVLQPAASVGERPCHGDAITPWHTLISGASQWPIPWSSMTSFTVTKSAGLQSLPIEVEVTAVRLDSDDPNRPWNPNSLSASNCPFVAIVNTQFSYTDGCCAGCRCPQPQPATMSYGVRITASNATVLSTGDPGGVSLHLSHTCWDELPPPDATPTGAAASLRAAPLPLMLACGVALAFSAAAGLGRRDGQSGARAPVPLLSLLLAVAVVGLSAHAASAAPPGTPGVQPPHNARRLSGAGTSLASCPDRGRCPSFGAGSTVQVIVYYHHGGQAPGAAAGTPSANVTVVEASAGGGPVVVRTANLPAPGAACEEQRSWSSGVTIGRPLVNRTAALEATHSGAAGATGAATIVPAVAWVQQGSGVFARNSVLLRMQQRFFQQYFPTVSVRTANGRGANSPPTTATATTAAAAAAAPADLPPPFPLPHLLSPAHWVAVQQAEHASVAAFNRVSLELMELGAPLRLLAQAQGAALEEVGHAEMAGALAALLNATAGHAAGAGGGAAGAKGGFNAAPDRWGLLYVPVALPMRGLMQHAAGAADAAGIADGGAGAGVQLAAVLAAAYREGVEGEGRAAEQAAVELAGVSHWQHAAGCAQGTGTTGAGASASASASMQWHCAAAAAVAHVLRAVAEEEATHAQLAADTVRWGVGTFAGGAAEARAALGEAVFAFATAAPAAGTIAEQ